MDEKTKRLEEELAFGLERIAILIDCGLDFKGILKIISKEKGEFSEFTKKIIGYEERGFSISESIRLASKEYKSENITRAVGRIINSYRSGERGERIEQIANDLIIRQEHEIKKYASKSAVYGIIFTALNVLVPTFAIMLYFIGGMIFGLEISQLQFEVFILAIIPAISMCLIFISKKQAPLCGYENKKNHDAIILLGIAIFSAIAVKINILILSIPVIITCIYSYKKYIGEKRIEKLEEELSDALLQMSGMEGQSFERIIREISNSNYRELSIEFKKSYNQVKSNVGFEKILEDLKERINSAVYARIIPLVKYIFESNRFEIFAQVSQNILRYFELRRERAAALSIQKYTLILGAVITPVIFSMTVKMMGSISKIMDISKEDGQITGFAIPAYLVIYSIISAYYIMGIEDKKSKGFIYLVFMMCTSLALYYIMTANSLWT